MRYPKTVSYLIYGLIAWETTTIPTMKSRKNAKKGIKISVQITTCLSIQGFIL